MDIRLCVDAGNQLGENPLWDVREQRLYWIDGLRKEIWRCTADGAEIQRRTLDSVIGSMALREGGGAVVALESGLHFYDFATGALDFVADPEAEHPRVRLNDGKVDAQGRFVVGSVDMARYDPEPPPVADGALYRLDPDLSIHRLETGIGCANGPCWSPDGKTFYLADTSIGVIGVYDWDAARGTLERRRHFAGGEGMEAFSPDGATVDSEGCLWSAMIGMGGPVSGIRRFTPDGRVDRTIALPTGKVTSVMFGGPELDILFVTSMGVGGFANDAPLDGAVFAIRGLGVRGVPERRFAG